MELGYIGKASNNLWSPGTLTTPNMSEWQLRVMRYLTYLRELLTNLSPIHNLDPTLLYGDNLGAIGIATNLSNTKRSRHIDIRYHLIREALINGILRLQYCRTNDMVADILTYGGLTKTLPIVTHEKHRTGAIIKVFFWIPHPLGGEYCGSFFSCSSGRAFYSCLPVAPTIGYSFFHRNGLFYGFPQGFLAFLEVFNEALYLYIHLGSLYGYLLCL
jgi:hypothetical protein